MPDTPAAAPAAAAPDPVALQQQIDALKTENAEKERTAQFWHEKATRVSEAAKPKEDADADADIDVLEAITTGGVKGLDQVLAKRGYVRSEEVDKRVNARAQQEREELQLSEQYPDLRKKDSEFFKSTATAYGDLIKQGVAPAVAMRMAAERTELAFMREGKIKTPGEIKAEKERERKARGTAAGAEAANRTAGHEEEDDTLTPQQMQIVRSMLVGNPDKDGKPMDEAAAIEVYKSRAKAGVQMKGVGR